MANKKILLGLTTITEGEWRNKIKEIDELGLEEIALFPTCLLAEERKELYALLEKTKIKNIPHVHLKSDDMTGDELEYFKKRFNAKVFNIHSRPETADFINRNKEYKDMIYLENLSMEDDFEKNLALCAGVCLDLAHWEDNGMIKKYKGYEAMPEILRGRKIGCNHISAIKPADMVSTDHFSDEKYRGRDYHYLDDLSEVDYVKKYKNYLADIISIELENPLKRQLEVKKYLEEIIL